MIIDQNEIDEDKLNSILDPMIAKAEAWNLQLSEERQKCLDLYEMAALGNEQEGFSRVVSDVVWSTVEWSKPALVDIFCHPDFWELRFDDSERADLIKKIIRYQMFSKQQGEEELTNWIHNGLMYHNGIIKYGYKEDYDLVKEQYDRLDEQQMEMLQQGGYDFSEYNQVEESHPDIPEYSQQFFEGVKAFKKVVTYAGPVFEAVPPHEFFITPGCKSIDTAPFVCHEVPRTVDDIRKGEKAGYYYAGAADRIIEKLSAGHESSSANQEITRIYDSAGLAFNPSDDQIGTSDKDSPVIGSSLFRLRECFIKYDIDGDGLLEDVIIKKYSDIIISVEENPYKRPPFLDACYHSVPHRFEGRPLPLVLKHDQRELTMMRRIFADAAAEAAYGTPVTSDMDLARQWENRSPGVILTKLSSNSSFEVLKTPPPDASLLKALEILQTSSERKTGVNSLNQGLDADSYGKTATGTVALQNAGQQMQKFHAKMFAVAAMRLVKAFIEINKLFPTSVQSIPGEGLQGIPEGLFDIEDFDIKIDVGVSHNDRVLQAQILENHFGKLVQVLIPQGLAGKEHLIKTQQKIGKLQNVPLDGLMYDDSEVSSLQQMQQQLQQQGQQLQQLMQALNQSQQAAQKAENDRRESEVRNEYQRGKEKAFSEGNRDGQTGRVLAELGILPGAMQQV